MSVLVVKSDFSIVIGRLLRNPCFVSGAADVQLYHGGLIIIC